MLHSQGRVSTGSQTDGTFRFALRDVCCSSLGPLRATCQSTRSLESVQITSSGSQRDSPHVWTDILKTLESAEALHEEKEVEFFYNKDDISEHLTSAFKERYARKDVALTGILLARPEDEFVAKEILPHLNWWNYRSDYYTDFYCAGYAPIDEVEEELAKVVTVADRDWGFSHRAFDELVEEIEGQIGWRYRGGASLILLNSRFDGERAHLDYFRSIRLVFARALESKRVKSATELADVIFEFAKNNNESSEDPAWELSDHLGKKVLKEGLVSMLLSWLPAWVSPSAREAMQYVLHENRASV